VEIPAEIGCGLVLPLLRPGPELFGFVLVGLTGTAIPDQATIDLARVLASHVAFAVDRAQLDERVAIGAEFARALLSLADLGDDSAGLLAGLRRAVNPAIGFHVLSVRLAGGSRRTRPATTEFERRIWRQWRARRTRPDVVEHDGLAYAPAWDGERVVGIVQAAPLRSPLATHERAALEALASAIAESVERERLRENADRRTRQAALAAEGADVADDIHLVLTRLLAEVDAAASQLAGSTPEAVTAIGARLSHLARAGRRELDQGRRSLFALTTADTERLETTLEDVIETLTSRLGVAADLSVRGDARPLPAAVEQTLVRVVQEALTRVEPHSRAGAIAVRLEYHPSDVEVWLRDDGVNLGQRETAALVGSHFGLRVIQRRLRALGGDLVVERPEPRGLLLRATVPA
jgi:signal transduction histidine kinase